MFKKQKKMTVMDFTGIYENEKFYKHKNIEWLDFRELQGVYGYCSQQARKSIEDKIYANIESNVDKTLIKDNAFVNIRVTILKDGRYEQLTFMDGSKDNFELFRSSITQVFPLKINDSLKENFPRYFRMKIEIK